MKQDLCNHSCQSLTTRQNTGRSDQTEISADNIKVNYNCQVHTKYLNCTHRGFPGKWVACLPSLPHKSCELECSRLLSDSSVNNKSLAPSNLRDSCAGCIYGFHRKQKWKSWMAVEPTTRSSWNTRHAKVSKGMNCDWKMTIHIAL